MLEPSITRSAFLEASIAATKVWLSTEFAGYSGFSLPTVMAKSPDDFRQLGRVDTRDGAQSPITTPFAIMSVGGIGLDGDLGGFRKNRANKGVQTGADRETGVSYHDDMRPAILSLGLAFVSDGFDNVLLFAEALLNAAPNVVLSLATDTGFVVHCTLAIEGELTTPPPDSDPGSLYRFETTMRLRTFIGHAHELRLIRRIRIGVVNDEKNSSDQGRAIYEGTPENLLASMHFEYDDLFNKDSPVYKYNHADVNGSST